MCLLKKCLGKEIVPVADLPESDSDGNFLIGPLSASGQRWIQRKGVHVFQIRVHWRNLDSDTTTWEDSKFLARKFPTFDPWGQGSLHGRGIVMATEGTKRFGESVKKKGVSAFGEKIEGGGLTFVGTKVVEGSGAVHVSSI